MPKYLFLDWSGDVGFKITGPNKIATAIRDTGLLDGVAELVLRRSNVEQALPWA